MNALERGLTIVETLALSDRPLGVSEIGAAVGVDKSAVHRLLTILTARGYTEKDPESKRYRLSPKVIHLGQSVSAKVKLIEEARPFVREMAKITGQSAHLAVLRDHRVVYLDEAVPNTSLRVDVPVGGLAPAYCTALGKALLSRLDDHQLSVYIDAVSLVAHTKRSLTSASALVSELADVRERGFAADDEEFTLGVYCLAAPVVDHTGAAVAALGVSGPKQQVARDRARVAEVVTTIAARLSRSLGFLYQ